MSFPPRLRAARPNRACCRALALAIPTLFAGPSALATSRTWLDTDGLSWTNTAGWQGGVVPVPGDIALIGTTGTGVGVPTLNYNGTYTSAAPLLLLDINATNVSVMTFSQALGSMAATTEIVGDTISGNVYSQSGGNNTATTLILGNAAFGNGNYNLLGTANLTVGTFELGNLGAGNFTQSGGNFTINTALTFASTNTTSNCTYSLSAGNLTFTAGTASLSVNGVAHAAFTQSGGTLNLNADPLDVYGSGYAGNNIVYSLSNGSIINAGTELVGAGGIGTALFNQSGGSNTFAPGFGLDVGFGGTGAYILSNGSLAPSSVYVGDMSNGTFTQTGGTATIAGNLTIGNSSFGTYLLGPGSLSDANETIGNGGIGAFTQSSGNHTVANTLTLGYAHNASGAYTMNGGNLTLGNATVSGSLLIGNAGAGTFTQTTGNVTVNGSSGTVALGTATNGGGGVGNYTLSGGSLSTAYLSLGSSSNATFNHNDGNVSVSTELDLATSAGESSFYNLSNGTGNPSLIVNNESLSISGNAFFSQSGGNHTVTGTLALALGTGTAAYSLSGGYLTVNHFIVGEIGTATVTQTGGNVTIGAGGGVINFYGLASAASSYTFSAGYFNAGAARGNFTINPGGTFTANGSGIETGYILNNGSFVAGSVTFQGTLENGPSGTFSFLPGTGFIATSGLLNNGSIVVSTGNLLGAGTGYALDNESSLTLAGGTLYGFGAILNNGFLSGFGTVGGIAGFTNNGYLSVAGGNLVFTTSGANSNAGTIALSPGRQLTLSNNLTNNGTLSLANGLLNGAATLTNSSSGSVIGPGTITAPFVNAGSLSPGAGTLLVTNPWINNGTIQPTGVGSLLTGALVTNNGSVRGSGTIASNITNLGSIEATGGVLVLAGAVTSNGTFRASPGNEILIQGGFTTNAGLINLAGGTFDNGNQLLNNTGTIAGYGVFSSSGLTNNGNITFTGGTATINGPVTNTSSHTLNIKYQPALFTGNFTNNAGATLKTTNTTATFTATFTNNGAYASDPATNIFSTLSNAGTMTGSVGDVFTISAGGSFTNSGTFTNGGTLNASSNVTNSGTFTQTGPQTWSNASGFTNTAGLATFGSSAKLASLTITGGTVDTTSSKLVIESTSKASTLAALQADAASGSLTSSTLPANLGLAIIDNAAVTTPFTTFGGMSVDTNSILIAPELLGDANVDGHVDLNDLNTVLNNLGTTSANWTAGNFDHSATIDLNDLNAVLNHLGTSYANSSAATSNALTPAAATTPEPASLALFALSVPMLLRVRPRRRTL